MFLMFRARWAYFRVLRVSSKSISAQLTQAIITLAAAACGAGEEIDPRSPTSGPAQAKPSPVAVREFPPKLSCRSLVNLDSRYGTWLPAEDVRRVTNRPSQKGKTNKDVVCASSQLSQQHTMFVQTPWFRARAGGQPNTCSFSVRSNSTPSDLQPPSLNHPNLPSGHPEASLGRIPQGGNDVSQGQQPGVD